VKKWKSEIPNEMTEDWLRAVEACLAEHREAIDELARGRDTGPLDMPAPSEGFDDVEQELNYLRPTLGAYRKNNARQETRIQELEAEVATSNELLSEINALLIGPIPGVTEDSEAWRMIKDMAETYRHKIEEALGGKEP